jgi:hypothetical protein
VARVPDAHALKDMRTRRAGDDLVIEAWLSEPAQWLPAP